jgi:hypothetical protein
MPKSVSSHGASLPLAPKLTPSKYCVLVNTFTSQSIPICLRACETRCA